MQLNPTTFIAKLTFLTLFSLTLNLAYAETVTTAVTQTQSPLIAVINRVQGANYPVVKSIELTHGVYKIEAINRLGQEVDIEVDPTTLNIIKPKASNALQINILDAINKVTQSGYHNIYKIESDDNSYEIQALDKDGNKVELTVDGATGKVSKNWF